MIGGFLAQGRCAFKGRTIAKLAISTDRPQYVYLLNLLKADARTVSSLLYSCSFAAPFILGRAMQTSLSGRTVFRRVLSDTTAAQFHSKTQSRPPASPKLPDIIFKLSNRNETGIRLSDHFRTFDHLVGAERQPLLGTVFEHNDMELHVFVGTSPNLSIS